MTNAQIIQNNDKALIVDGNSIMNRAFYAIRPLSTKAGIPTNAVWGFLTILLKHIDSLNPSHGVVAFDLPKPTFRHVLYDDYKAGRKSMPDELRAQMPWVKKCVSALGFHVLESEGYEADDILGTTAGIIASHGGHAYVLTGDRDSLQLIGDNTTVLIAANSDTLEFDRSKFFDTYGVPSELFVDVKALMGDSSDNIPGVPGIGEKTALKLVAAYGELDNIYRILADDELNVSKSVRTKLADGKDSAYMSKHLATIKCDVPLECDYESLRLKQPENDELYSLFTELEFSTLVKRLSLSEEKTSAPIEVVQLSSADVASLAASVYGIETDGDTLTIADIASDKVYSAKVDSESLKLFAESGHTLITPDAKKLYNLLRTYGLPLPSGRVFDLGIAAYVLDSNDNSYALPRLVASYLGEQSDDNAQNLLKSKRLMDALVERFTPEEQKIYDELEMPLADVLSEMECSGFKVDRAGLAGFSAVLTERADELHAQIIELAGGEEFNLNSPKQLGEVLFEKLGLPATKKTKTGYSTNAEALEHLSGVPIVQKLLEWRQVTKLRTTYADGLLAVADAEGRVHSTFHQTVTATGRLSSADPNLQNIPIRQELGREMRRFFIPKSDDYVLVDADYSQIELRLLAAASGDERMTEAFNSGVDIHTVTASQVFGVPVDEVSPEQRKRAKAVNFGIIYGISEFSLATDIGVSRWQAGEYIRSYFANYSGVDGYMKTLIEDAKKNGYVTTMLGRRRYIPELTSSKAQLRAFGERVAMNSPIQGTAAEVMKLAMLGVSRALKEAKIDARIILQVHDELVLEASRADADRAAEILKNEMEHAVDLAVPLTVDLTVGENWYN